MTRQLPRDSRLWPGTEKTKEARFIESLLCVSPCTAHLPDIYLSSCRSDEGQVAAFPASSGEAEERSSPSWKDPQAQGAERIQARLYPAAAFQVQKHLPSCCFLSLHTAPRKLQNPSASWEGKRVSLALLVARDSLSSLAGCPGSV